MTTPAVPHVTPASLPSEIGGAVAYRVATGMLGILADPSTPVGYAIIALRSELIPGRILTAGGALADLPLRAQQVLKDLQDRLAPINLHA